MTVRITVDDPAARASGSWLLEVDEATTIGEAAESLGVPTTLLDPTAPGDAPLGESVLSGARLPADRQRTDRVAPGTLRLEVVGGPFAGESVPLARGATLAIGSASNASVAIADPSLAPLHATLARERGHRRRDGRSAPLTATVTPAAPGLPIWVNGEAVEEPVDLVPADLLQLGNSMLRIGVAPMPDADLTRDALGARGFNRPSRIRPAQEQPVVQLPGDKPADPDQSPMPWLSAIIPVVLGVTMAIVFGRAIMLLMAAASPIMVVGSFMANRRMAKRKGLKTEAQWIDDVKAAGRRIAELARIQRLEAWYRLPDPVVVADIATAPLARLWERRRGDDDALLLRVGVTEVALDVRFEGGGKDRSAHAARRRHARARRRRPPQGRRRHRRPGRCGAQRRPLDAHLVRDPALAARRRDHGPLRRRRRRGVGVGAVAAARAARAGGCRRCSATPTTRRRERLREAAVDARPPHARRRPARRRGARRPRHRRRRCPRPAHAARHGADPRARHRAPHPRDRTRHRAGATARRGEERRRHRRRRCRARPLRDRLGVLPDRARRRRLARARPSRSPAASARSAMSAASATMRCCPRACAWSTC